MRQSFGLHHTFLEMCEKYSTEKRIIKRSCSLIKQILQIRYQPWFCLDSVLSQRSFLSYRAQKSWEVWSIFNPVTWSKTEYDPGSNRKIMVFTHLFFFLPKCFGSAARDQNQCCQINVTYSSCYWKLKFKILTQQVEMVISITQCHVHIRCSSLISFCCNHEECCGYTASPVMQTSHHLTVWHGAS